MSDDEAQILRANTDQNRRMVEADTHALEALLTPGFELVHITGYAQPKAEWLEEIRSGGMAYPLYSVRASRRCPGSPSAVHAASRRSASADGLPGSAA